ncbi:MAG: 3-mercaptopyruvate sulfurtransferase [Caulobacteraceae bacterium]
MTPGPLVSTAWLAARLDDPGLAVIDATWFMPGEGRDARAEHAGGHIPGAVFFGIDDIRDEASELPHMLAGAARFAAAARRLGVNDASRVVVYDSHGLFSAPRVWWNFRAMGHDQTFVLDGGLPRWRAEGRPQEAGWRSPSHGDFHAATVPALVADLEAVRAAVAGHGQTIVDARPAGRFAGRDPEPRAGLRSGHMPGARNVPWSRLVRDGALDAPAALLSVFEAAGVIPGEPIVATCGSGVSAALAALALARVGAWDVAVYDGSWAEWGSRADTAVALGEPAAR